MLDDIDGHVKEETLQFSIVTWFRREEPLVYKILRYSGKRSCLCIRYSGKTEVTLLSVRTVLDIMISEGSRAPYYLYWPNSSKAVSVILWCLSYTKFSHPLPELISELSCCGSQRPSLVMVTCGRVSHLASV